MWRMSVIEWLLPRSLRRRPTDRRDALRPAYAAVIERARHPGWYLAGVPDSMDGRFEMVAAILSQLLLRLEGEAEAAEASVALTELFVDDMDGQLRQIGIGDVVVGKHMGKMMSALGGRLGAYRAAGDDAAAIADVLRRNLALEVEGPAIAAGQRLLGWRQALVATPVDALVGGQLPPLPA